MDANTRKTIIPVMEIPDERFCAVCDFIFHLPFSDVFQIIRDAFESVFSFTIHP